MDSTCVSSSNVPNKTQNGSNVYSNGICKVDATPMGSNIFLYIKMAINMQSFQDWELNENHKTFLPRCISFFDFRLPDIFHSRLPDPERSRRGRLYVYITLWLRLRSAAGESAFLGLKPFRLNGFEMRV